MCKCVSVNHSLKKLKKEVLVLCDAFIEAIKAAEVGQLYFYLELMLVTT